MDSLVNLWPTPRAAYIHVPFCRHRCGYCNFSVVADRDDLIERYLKAVDSELRILDRPVVDTLFIGGGTPTHFDLTTLDRFLSIVSQRFQLTTAGEWTMEANPEDITSEKLALLADHGVNRVSLGVQSFNSTKLALLERGHSPQVAMKAVELAAEAVGNVSIDLIFAAPGETLADWQADLDLAIKLPLQHLSTYALTFEKGTRFWSRRERGDLQSPTETSEVDMYQLARQVLDDSRFRHYEISSFAKSDARCRHNLAYWQGCGWYAAGPGAARFVGANAKSIIEARRRTCSAWSRDSVRLPRARKSHTSSMRESEPHLACV